jgi:fucose permease
MEQIVTLLCVFGLGMCFSLLGSISVKLMPRLKIDTARFGTLISSFMITCLVASVVIGVLIDIWGHKPFAIIGFIVTAFCIFIIARATSYSAVLAACLLLGVGAMCLNNVGNTLMPHVLFGGQNAPAALNLGNVFFGLGLFLTPFIVSFLFRKVAYENAVSVLALIALVPVIFAILAKYPDVKLGFEAATVAKLLASPVVIVAALALFCYISLEMSFSNWLPSFGKEVISSVKPDADAGVIDASSQRMLSAFAVAMMAGRLITSQIPIIAEYGSYFIAGAALLSCLVILVMMAIRNVSLAWLMAILAGLFFAPCFPTTVGVTFNKHPENQGTVFGVIFAVGLLGGVIIPKAIGNLAKGSSVQKSLKLLVPACVALIILALILGRL